MINIKGVFNNVKIDFNYSLNTYTTIIILLKFIIIHLCVSKKKNTLICDTFPEEEKCATLILG